MSVMKVVDTAPVALKVVNPESVVVVAPSE